MQAIRRNDMALRNTKYIDIATSKFLLFIIWPFGSFLHSLTNLKSKSSFIIIFLFCILFGYTFLAENKYADSYKYIEEFKASNELSASTYFKELHYYFTLNSKTKDIYVLTCNFLISAFTRNYHILMAFYAAVFAFFYLKSFRFIVKRPEFSMTFACYILAFLFTFSNPIFNINGVRFWTAGWIAVYSLFQIIVNKKINYLILAFFTPIIHISYLSFIIVIIIYLLLKGMENVWMIAYLVSFFVTNIALQFIGSLNDYMPQVIQNMIWSYTEENNLATRIEQIQNLPLYAKILNSLPNLFLNALMIVFIFNQKKIRQKIEAFPIYIFLLVWMTFVNFTYSIPSFGGRYISLAVPFITYLSLLVYKQVPIISKIIYLTPLVYSYTIFYWVRNMISISDPFLYLTNLFHLLYKNF